MTEPDKRPEPKPASPAEGPPQGRRGFFSQAMRETMGPVASMLEKRINPLLQAMEQLPDEMNAALGSLAGPTQPPRRVPLDQVAVSDAETTRRGEAAARIGEPLRFLRPPGAGPDFATACSRCQACVRVCGRGAGLRGVRIPGVHEQLPDRRA
jgi:ferredoxin